MILDLIVYIALSVTIIILLINNLRLHLKTKKLTAKFLQHSLDKEVIIDRLKKELEKRNPDSVEKTEGFLKFISESREWAFKYIEDVQAALNKFKNSVEPKLKYANTYGTVAGPSVHLSLIEEITLAYIELKKIMPEDDEKENEGKQK